MTQDSRRRAGITTFAKLSEIKGYEVFRVDKDDSDREIKDVGPMVRVYVGHCSPYALISRNLELYVLGDDLQKHGLITTASTLAMTTQIRRESPHKPYEGYGLLR